MAHTRDRIGFIAHTLRSVVEPSIPESCEGWHVDQVVYSARFPIAATGVIEDAVDSLGLIGPGMSYDDAVREFPLDVLSEAIEAAEALNL